MTEVALEAEGLGRRYGRTWGLQDCSFALSAGSITGLVGPNGAGKSTLLHMACGLARPTTGTVAVCGHTVRVNGIAHLADIGYLDQLRPLYGSMRMRDLCTLGRKLNQRWDDALASQWLESCGIALDARVGKLSVGQQVLAALALCMAKRPKLLLLDEPTASLDPLARQRLFQAVLGHVTETGMTVVLSSHVVSELEPVCDHLVLLNHSRLQFASSVDALVAQHRVLTGPPGNGLPSGVEAIGDHGPALRQSTVLVKGVPTALDPPWRVDQPRLDEIVLAYLALPAEQRSARLEGVAS